eukprot:2405054-Prymnesium_polylepis.3
MPAARETLRNHGIAKKFCFLNARNCTRARSAKLHIRQRQAARSAKPIANCVAGRVAQGRCAGRVAQKCDKRARSAHGLGGGRRMI